MKCAIPFLTSSWKRAGYNTLTKFFYNRQKREQESMQRMFAHYWKGKELSKESVGVGVIFVVPMPRSWTAKKKEQMLGTRCTAKPDIDNLIKFILDAMSGVVFDDDRQCFLSERGVSKYWGHQGRTFIWLESSDHRVDVQAIEATFPEELPQRAENIFDLPGVDEDLCDEDLCEETRA